LTSKREVLLGANTDLDLLVHYAWWERRGSRPEGMPDDVGKVHRPPQGHVLWSVIDQDFPTGSFARGSIHEAVDRLPSSHRQVIEGLFWEGLSEKQMAQRLGCARTTVYRQRIKAFATLRRTLPLIDSWLSDLAYGSRNGPAGEGGLR
jgi:DNA-directed RNA polymerase specialized sigma24 family protein